jgi:Protein of unknown function (DUF2905)
MQDIGKLLIVVGVLTALVGGALLLAGRIPWFGRLPGDVVVQRGPVTFYFPIVTSIIVSVILSLILNLFRR